jgi:hypothetical protein
MKTASPGLPEALFQTIALLMQTLEKNSANVARRWDSITLTTDFQLFAR